MERNNAKIYVSPKAKALLEYETVDRWITDVMTERTGSEKTKAAYLNYFCNFVEWARGHVEGCSEATPDGIVEMAIEKLKADVMSDWAEKTTKKWFMWMCTEGKLARTTAKTRYGVARSFFRSNRIKFIGKTPSATVRTRYIIPEKEKLQEMWKIADLFEKIRIGILNDTGMRPEDAVNLSYETIRDSFERDEEHIYLTDISEKEDQPYAVFLTKSMTRLMHTYFEFRVKNGEVIADDSPVLTKRRDLGKYIGVNQLYRDINGLGKQIGIKISPKIFRKRFRTECTPIIGRDATMKMGGWALPGVGKQYFLPTKAQTLRDYRKVEKLLCLEDIRTIMDKAERKKAAFDMLKAAGLDPDELLRVMKIVRGTNNALPETGPED